jgi:putative acetyltransferase
MNISIRRAEPGDFEAIVKVYSAPKVIWGTLQLPFPSAERLRKRMAEPPEGIFELLACVEGEVIGELSLHSFPNAPRRRHVGQIGMAVHDDWQGKGAGTALMQATVDLADKWLNLTRLELEVYTDNERAIKLYQKFDFVTEGTLRRFAFRDGQYVDAYLMARVRAAAPDS